MNAAEPERLPSSVSGLLDLAGAAYLERARLYLLLAAGVFVVCGIVEFAWATSAGDAGMKATVLELLDLFTDAFVITAIALGVAMRISGDERPTATLLAGALERWLAVLGAMTIVQYLVTLTIESGMSGIGPVASPVLTIVSAPVIWLFWGALSLAGPVAALSADRPTLAIITGFGRALYLALQPRNLGRLCIVAFAGVIPTLLQSVLFDILSRGGVANSDFWASLPLDALTVGPLAALQTVFALDFARRVTPSG